MRTRSVCGFFLTWVRSYENHCFEIKAHTFIFQIEYPILREGCYYSDQLKLCGDLSQMPFVGQKWLPISLPLSYIFQPVVNKISTSRLTWLNPSLRTWNVTSLEMVWMILQHFDHNSYLVPNSGVLLPENETKTKFLISLAKTLKFLPKQCFFTI